MRLLVLSHALGYGGAEVSTLQFLKLLKDVYDIDVIVGSGADTRFLSDLRVLGLRVVRVPVRRYRRGMISMEVERVKDIIRKVDAVWITHAEYPTAQRVKKIKEIPIIAHFRDYMLICPWWSACFGSQSICMKRCSIQRIIRCKQLKLDPLVTLGFFSRKKAMIYRWLYFVKGPIDFIKAFRSLTRNIEGIIKSIDGFIAVSKAMKNILISHVPELTEKPFEVVYNPIDIPVDIVKFSIYNKNPSKMVVYASGFNSAKGIHIFLQSVRFIAKEMPEVRIVIVGKYDEKLTNLIRKYNIEKYIQVVGFLPYREILKLFAESQVVTMPSIWPEPFGRIAAEANMLGVPVVASRVGGLPEVVESGVTGFLVKPGDPEDLAEGVMKALTTKFDREKIHRITAAKFDSIVAKNHFIHFLESFVG